MKTWEYPLNLIAVHPVATLIGAASGSVLHLAAGNNFGNDIGELTDPVVLSALSDVEGLVVDGISRRVENTNARRGDVANVSDGPPGRAIAFDIYFCRRPGCCYQVVQDDIQTEARRDA